MFNKANCAAVLLLIICMAACRQPAASENEEVTLWRTRFIDSTYKLLYQDKDTLRALRHFDAAFASYDQTAIYPQAIRYDLLANYHYFYSGNNDITAGMIDSALALFNTIELQNQYPRTYVGLLLFGGQIAYRLLHYSKANDYYFKAKKLVEAYLNPCEQTAFNYNIAMVLFRQQNFKQSRHFFSEAFARQGTCAPQTTAIVLQQQEIQSNIGLCDLQLRHYDSAAYHFNIALQVAQKFKDSLGPVFMDKIYGVVYGHLAQVALAKGRLNDAEQLSLKSIALNDREGFEKEHAMGIKLQLTDIYHRQADLSSMQQMLQRLRRDIDGANAKHHLEWHRLMGSYYEQVQQPDSALHYLKRYHALQDAEMEEQKRLTAADVARQIKENEQELQIAVLKKDQHLTLVSLWVTIVFSLMALIIIYLVYVNYRRNKKSLLQSLALNEEIRLQKAAREEEAKQQHKLITKAVIRAQESERSLIGLELHDNVGQVLTTVKLHNEMLLQGIGDPKLILPRAIQYLQNCISEIRSLSKRLSAPTLGNISLEESVDDLIESINLTSKVRITRHISGLENELLQKDLHLGLYRILQEQLNNVLKHADASEVVIQLEKVGDTIRLCITDNGKGFAAQKSKSGIGLMNMQTRAENLSGTFEVASNPGQGCRVEVVVPLCVN
jgi:signal transduction histidine kinase